MYLVNKAKSEQGFTLMEVMVVLTILAILIVPMFRIMEITYGSVSEEHSTQSNRESFRLFTVSLLEDILYATSINVTNKNGYDLLSYTSLSGQQKTVYFDEDTGISFINEHGNRQKLSDGERYEPYRNMVAFDGTDVHFNFYARELNVLFVTTITPRLLGGE